MYNLSDCVHVPDVPLAQSMVRGVDCFTKAFSIVLVVINLPLPYARIKPFPMHVNLKVGMLGKQNCFFLFLLLSFVLVF